MLLCLSQDPRGELGEDLGNTCIIKARSVSAFKALTTQQNWSEFIISLEGKSRQENPRWSSEEAELIWGKLPSLPVLLGISPPRPMKRILLPVAETTFSIFLFPNLVEKMQIDMDSIKMLSPVIDIPYFVSLLFGLLAWQQLNLTK